MLVLFIMTLFTSSPFIQNLYCCVGVMLFGVYLIIDTQMILGGKTVQLNIDEYAVAAMLLYIDIIQIFLYILRLLSSDDWFLLNIISNLSTYLYIWYYSTAKCFWQYSPKLKLPQPLIFSPEWRALLQRKPVNLKGARKSKPNPHHLNSYKNPLMWSCWTNGSIILINPSPLPNCSRYLSIQSILKRIRRSIPFWQIDFKRLGLKNITDSDCRLLRQSPQEGNSRNQRIAIHSSGWTHRSRTKRTNFRFAQGTLMRILISDQ